MRTKPTLLELFACGLEIASHSFGGAAAWTRFVLVERRKLLADEEFTELWSLAQMVPGPTVVSLLSLLGDRMRGPAGALAAFAGILVVPTAFVLGLDAFLMRWIHVPIVWQAVAGLGAVAAGLVLAMGIQMGARFRRDPIPALLAGTTFVLAGPLHLPLAVVVLLTAPAGLVWARKRMS
jgi:chromate transporter